MKWRTKNGDVSPSEAVKDPVRAYGVVEVRYFASLLRGTPADGGLFHQDPARDAEWDRASADLLRAIQDRKLYDFSWGDYELGDDR